MDLVAVGVIFITYIIMAILLIKTVVNIVTRIFTRKEMSEMSDVFQVNYLPEKKEIRINLPEEVWENIDTVIMTRLFQEELVVEKQKESEEKKG